ncbi:MAG: CotH kinase family protein [Bacteroidota bacterium]|nr:CotH kinase family protein [Bacteroidota bacterium]
MKFLLLAFCLTFPFLFSAAQPFRINEVMSSNGGALTDSDGDSSDWIEFFNSGTTSVNLKDFGLSDKKTNPFKWLFPDLTVNPGEYLIVFASGKDRRDMPVNWNTLVSQGDDWKYLVPTTEPTANWRLAGFDDVSWKTGKSGFGQGDNDDATVVTVPRSIFLRKKINITNAASVRQLVLHMDYDDGFVAYLNGVEIAREQMLGKGALPRFDETASGQHEALIYQNLAPEKFLISNHSAILKSGENILAIQVHNVNTTSSDLSAIPFLSVETIEKPVNPRVIGLLNLGKNELHTNFKISANGESLYLTNPSGILADSVRIGALQTNYSYGRTLKDPTVWNAFDTSTPGQENSGGGVSGEDPGKPVFSLPGGIYSGATKIVLTAPTTNDTIYYTTDGSVPTRSSLKAGREIDIPGSRVVRARILKSGMLPGKTVTNSYIIYGNKKMPVVSISMNPADLWDYNTGIYVLGPKAETTNPNFGANFWMDWEKAAHFELMETNGNKVIDVDAGVKIYGNWSRANAQKSMAFYCRKAYGSDEMKYKIFQERPFNEFKTIVLRNSGNDWNNTMFRDGLMTGLTLGLDVDQQAFRPATIFLNGEYWGILNIREKINEHFIAANHDVDSDEVILMENNGTAINGSPDEWLNLYSFIGSNNLSLQPNYDQVVSKIDLGNYIDYTASQIFYANHDWPGNNIKYWKTTASESRWRWIMFDTDFGMGIWNRPASQNSIEIVTATNGTEWHNLPWSTLMLRKMLENTGFRNQFVNRFADLMNSTFLSERVHKAIDLKRDAITDEISSHLYKWNGGSKSGWLSNVQMMKNFATDRPYYMFTHLQQKFKFQIPQHIEVLADSLAGSVQLNSLKLTKFPWNGSYFQEVPITLTAIPKAGFRFLKWEGVTSNSSSVTISLAPKSQMKITAVFESDGSHYENIVINEISFNNNAATDPGDWIELTNKGAFDVDISGWKLTDSDPNHQFIFAANTIIKANGYLVIANDLAKFKAVFGSIVNLHEPFAFNFGLSNTVDAVKLYSGTGQLIDEVNYKNSEPWQTYSFEELWSLELINPNKNNNSGLNWVLSERNGTPGLRNTPVIIDAVEDLPVAQNATELLQNYPNPFNGGTYIEFKLDRPGKYNVSILDVNGRTLRVLSGDNPFSTVHTIYWDGNDNSGKPGATGVYFYRLESNGFSEMKRMVKM